MLFGQADRVLSAIEGLARLRGFRTGNYIVSEDSPSGYRMFIFLVLACGVGKVD
jgi:hypothetical protein